MSNVSITPRHAEEIRTGQRCPYCLRRSVLRLHRCWGYMYICVPCDARVGCHKDTRVALGRLANAELRQAKKSAHCWFDPLWKGGHMHRKQAYAWLSATLGIPGEHTHIGMFDLDQCNATIEACKAYFVKLSNDLL